MIDTSQLDDTAQPEAIELRDALVDYKQRSGRMFPTCSEVLEVIRELGYERLAAPVDDLSEETDSLVQVEGQPV